MINRILVNYGLIGSIRLYFSWMKTKLIFKNARLIRFRLRGRRYIEIQKGFTAGFNCRLDAFNINNKDEALVLIG